MEAQLNNDPDVDTTFYTLHLSYEVSTQPKNYSSEEAYVKEALEELYNAGKLLDGDSVIIADSAATGGNFNVFGYGSGNWTWSPSGSNEQFTGARVLHTPSQFGVDDPVETFYNLAIHEVAHGFTGVDHSLGGYSTSYDNGDIVAEDVSPLATAYTYTNGDVVDTDYAGRSTPPNSFCDNVSNYYADKWCGGSANPCRHTTQMTDCTKNEIDSNTPL